MEALNHSGLATKTSWIAAVATGLLCLWAAQQQAALTDRDLRNALLNQAVALAQTINAEHISELSFTPADGDRPAYQRLCAQMAAFKSQTPFNGIWSLALRDGKLIFGPESYAPGTPLASPPGTPYLKPSSAEFDVFKNGKAYVKGPQKDEYGEFVYAVAPVLEPHTGNVCLAVGVDLLSRQWRAILLKASLLAALRVLPPGLILLAGLWLIDRRKRLPPEHKKRLRYAEAVTVALFFLSLTLLVAYESHAKAHLAQRQVFAQLASNQAHRLTAQFHQVRDNVLGGISHFFRSSERVSRAEFESFAATLLRQNGVFGIGWLERISQEDREAWSSHALLEGYPNAKVWTPPAGLGPRRPYDLEGRPLLYPVLHALELRGGGLVVGLDEGACPTRRAAIEETVRSGLTTATPPLQLHLSSGGDETGLLAYRATRTADGTARLMGIAMVAFKPKDLLQALLGPVPPEALSSHVTIHQLSQTQEPPLFVAEWGQNGDTQQGLHIRTARETGMVFPIFAFGCAYALTCSPGRGFLSSYPVDPVWPTVASGLTITALLTLLTVFFIRRHADLEFLVERRTQALRLSENNYRLAEEREHLLNQMLMAIRNVNQLIVREQNIDSLLHAACRNLTETLGYRTAWITLFDDGGALSAFASSGLGDAAESFRQKVAERHYPPCIQAILSGQRIALNPPSEEVCPSLCGGDAPRETCMGMTARIEFENRVYGVLAVALPSPLARDRMAASLFTELADDLGFALHKIETADALAESETRFRSLVDGAPDAIFVQTGGTFAFLNPSAAILFGAPSCEALIGRAVLDFSLPDNRDAVQERIRRLNEKRQPVPAIEETIVRSDGQAVAVEISAVPFRFWGENGALVFARDISARKRAEEQHRKLEEQFHQSQKLESLGQLAGGVAHDFNNMLQVILGNTELLLQESVPESPLAETLRDIRNAGQRSAELTRQLLAFARKQTVAPRPLDLNATIADQLKLLGRLIGEHISLRWLPGEGLPPVKMDPAQVNQILTNLAVNARDAIRERGTLTVETSHLFVDTEDTFDELDIGPGHYLVLAVSDDGCGMDKATRAHIFEPFFTTKPTGQGTGLGLSTVYGIVRQCDGFVNVYSEPGHGSTFRIYLPSSTDTVPAPSAKADEAAHALTPHTVLLVEDEPSLLNFAVKLLKKMGLTVLAAKGPAEALRLAEANPDAIHLLLTDVVMPDMSGRELQLRLLQQRPQLRTLFMSGYTADVIAHHNVLDEGIHFLQKPFSAAELRHAVIEVFNAPCPTAPSPDPTPALPPLEPPSAL
ncbi:MAG TPA: CHASE domain-containing protein [Kiritimatiellia bacterium]|nr:CHASE domain-containing protein [Kiritimatiellia bacterium]HPS06519.1 CHASE domain-containing protein [Kiritimatiellia bacterium]